MNRNQTNILVGDFNMDTDFKLLVITNALDYHSIPILDEMSRQFKKFFVIYYNDISMKEKKAMKWGKFERPYAKKYDDNYKKQLIKDVNNADCVIFDLMNNSIEIVKQRLEKDRLTFISTERMFKKSILTVLRIKNLKTVYQTRIKYKNNQNTYYLCRSGFLPYDLRRLGLKKDHFLKWGYFTNIKYKPKDTDDKIRILWAGRMIYWKHPEDCIFLANKLLENQKKNFIITVIGSGKEKNNFLKRVKKHGLSSYFEVLDFCSREEIVTYYEKSDYFLFTSSKQEGWGVVLNEALSTGCVCIASSTCGATPFLIEHGKNGYIYNRKRKNDIYLQFKESLDNIESVRRNAVETMNNTWSCYRAVYNLKKFIDNREFAIEGPCSRAQIIRNNQKYYG